MGSPSSPPPGRNQDDRAPPRLLASANPVSLRRDDPPDLFRTVQFSADGTTLLASTWNHSLSAYVLPQDLLTQSSPPCGLTPQATTRFQSPIRSLAPSPFFSLADPTTQTALVATTDHPIQLHQLFPPAPDASRLASYRLVNNQTEAYIAPTALLWPSPGNVFLCGSANRLDVFDLSREGDDGHCATLQTAPRASARGWGSVHGWKGTISALAATAPDAGSPMLAAGSWNRWVALYDYFRTPDPISHWCLTGATDPVSGKKIHGGGVVQTIWSPCGRYLALNERNSDGVLVYDIRKGHRLLGVLGPRNARTQMRLGCDVFATGAETSDAGGFEVWGGTEDGTVNVWEDAGTLLGGGNSMKTWGWKAHDAPVTNTALHPTGSVVVTSAGILNSPTDSVMKQKVGKRDGDGLPEIPMMDATPDRSLKIWECAA